MRLGILQCTTHTCSTSTSTSTVGCNKLQCVLQDDHDDDRRVWDTLESGLVLVLRGLLSPHVGYVNNI